MTLENIYYIGQTIAVAAILISLIAIWLQIRQGHRFARADRSNQLRQAQNELTMRVIDDKEIAQAFRILVYERGRVDDKDMMTRLMAWFGAFSVLYTDVMDASEKGLVDDVLLEDMDNTWVNISQFRLFGIG